MLILNLSTIVKKLHFGRKRAMAFLISCGCWSEQAVYSLLEGREILGAWTFRCAYPLAGGLRFSHLGRIDTSKEDQIHTTSTLQRVTKGGHFAIVSNPCEVGSAEDLLADQEAGASGLYK